MTSPGERERKRRYRDRRRRGVRVYPVEISDVDLAELIDRGEISEFHALDVTKVAIVASRLLSATITRCIPRQQRLPRRRPGTDNKPVRVPPPSGDSVL
jgi:hypothetical protein